MTSLAGWFVLIVAAGQVIGDERFTSKVECQQWRAAYVAALDLSVRRHIRAQRCRPIIEYYK